jgi:hypothetical protein
MARIAIVATAASTTVSIVTMNQAARFADLGEGWVIPMVLMKAFDMRRRSFTLFRCSVCSDSSRIEGVESDGLGVHLLDKSLPEWWRAHTLEDV